MSKMMFDMFISIRSQNGSVESWQSPPQLACVTEEGEVMAGDTAVVTSAGPETLEASFDAMESAESSGSGSVYGRRNPWGNQSYADLITQVSRASVMFCVHPYNKWKLHFRPFLAAQIGG